METDFSNLNTSEVTNKLELKNFLNQHPLGVLATVTSEGQPQTAVLYCKLEDDFTSYFVTKEQTRKITNLSASPAAAFTAYDKERAQSAEILGHVEVVNDMNEVAQQLPLLHNLIDEIRRDYWIPPVAQIQAGSYRLCRLIPDRIRFIDYGSYKLGEREEPRSFTIDFETKS